MKLCECGCGQPAPIAKVTSRHFGWVKGEPKRFISGHNGRGKHNGHYKGGLSRCDGRTIIVHRDGKSWTFWYRAVMEAHLGRELRSEEVVHHINGDGADDRLENLEVLSRAEHIAVHRSDLIAAKRWAAA